MVQNFKNDIIDADDLDKSRTNQSSTIGSVEYVYNQVLRRLSLIIAKHRIVCDCFIRTVK